MKTMHVSASDLTHNARIKRYPDGSCDVLVCSAPIFKTEGWEAAETDGLTPRAERGEAAKTANLERAQRRARSQLRDIALCTPFTYFVTLTLDPGRIDRYDPAAVTKRLNQWLDNNVRRRGLCYVLVPELHKDGAIHFHGFFNDALPVVASGVVDKSGHPVYNLPGWTLGFTTAIRLYGDYRAAVSYVTKYISKSADKVGGRWYYSGGDVRRPVVELTDWPFPMEDDGSYRFTVEDAGTAFALYHFEAECTQ